MVSLQFVLTKTRNLILENSHRTLVGLGTKELEDKLLIVQRLLSTQHQPMQLHAV